MTPVRINNVPPAEDASSVDLMSAHSDLGQSRVFFRRGTP